MLGLVLEGGGAKGSFHVGALKALFERGYQFNAVMGTSIGALNGALVAQNDFDKLYEVWQGITPSTFFDIDDSRVAELVNKSWNKDTVIYFLKFLRGTIANRGISTDRLKSLAAGLINEDKIRSSNIDFGVVTVSLTDDWMPIEIFKNEMPYGTLNDYIMASAYFPAFKINPLGGKKYIDGGIYDNLPINPLIRKGYHDIIAIRTNSNMPHKKVIDKSVRVNYIIPSESLGRTLTFTNEMIEKNIKLGYFDALRFLDNLRGKSYYIKPMEDSAFLNLMKEKYGIENILEIMESQGKILMMESFSYFDAFLKVLESYALSYNIDRFQVMTMEEFLDKVKTAHKEKSNANKYTNMYLNNLFYRIMEKDE